jgi:spore coat polysaccharide biosynthesis protein SpsF (cytidylyltransferase family)
MSNKLKICIVIQARTGSKRLPNKILKNFYNQKSILDLIVEKLIINFSNYPIILATSDCKNDSLLVDFAKNKNILYFQGNESNVLLRFIDSVKDYDFTHIIRICSDNPFLNMSAIQNLIDNLDSEDLDYISYENAKGIPVIKTHLGLFAEIVSVKSLKKANELQNMQIYQEHVTNYIYGNPEIFKVKFLSSPEMVHKRDDIRLTLDDLDDFENLENLYSKTFESYQDLLLLTKAIDANQTIKDKMINNIKKYTK